jgi:hypothetical protein
MLGLRPPGLPSEKSLMLPLSHGFAMGYNTAPSSRTFSSPPPFYLVDNLLPHMVDCLPLWPSKNLETESNSFMARSTC